LIFIRNGFARETAMLKLFVSITLLLMSVFEACAAAPETCGSSAFRGENYSGSEMECTYNCRSGQKLRIVKWSIDGLGGGIFTVLDKDGKQLFRGHTNADYKNYKDPLGEYDSNLSIRGLAVKFCKD
jgi:hypothetical protein